MVEIDGRRVDREYRHTEDVGIEGRKGKSEAAQPKRLDPRHFSPAFIATRIARHASSHGAMAMECIVARGCPCSSSPPSLCTRTAAAAVEQRTTAFGAETATVWAAPSPTNARSIASMSASVTDCATPDTATLYSWWDEEVGGDGRRERKRNRKTHKEMHREKERERDETGTAI